MRYLITITSLFGLLLSCTCGGEDYAFINSGASQLDHTFHADETELKGGFSFATTSDWSIEIKDKTETSKSVENNSWVTVSPMNGLAGDANIAINMEVNNTGKSRNVEIDINSGGSVMTIFIEQKSFEKVVKSVKVDFIIREENDTDAPWTVSSSNIIDFKYDDFRLIEVQQTEDNTLAIEYHSDAIVETTSWNSNADGVLIAKMSIEVKNILNPEGVVVVVGEKLREVKVVASGETFKFPKEYELKYNNGRLTNSVITSYNSDKPINTTYVWSGENLTEKIIEETPNINSISFSYSDNINSTNLDLNVIIAGTCHSLLDLPTLIRKTGKSSKNLVSRVVDRYEIPAKFWDESVYSFKYELDDDGYVVKVKRYFSFHYSSQSTASEEILDAIYNITYL